MAEVNDLEQSIVSQLENRGLAVKPQANGPDLIATAMTSDGPATLLVEVKTRPTPATRLPSHAVGRPITMIAEPYVSPRRGRTLQALDIPYVDSVGNMWLALPGLRVEVEGRPRPPGWTTSRRADISQLSRPSSLKIIFVLLTRPELLQLTIRELAEACRTSVGATQAALADLTTGGFIHGSVPDRRLSRTAVLADLWVSQFPLRLLPKLNHLTRRGPGPSWWVEHVAELSHGDVSLGGEAACELLGYPLRSVETLLYGTPPWPEARKIGRLSATSGPATVELREQFWPADPDARPQTTPILLVYADLLAADDPRLVQLARELRESDDDLRRLWSS